MSISVGASNPVFAHILLTRLDFVVEAFASEAVGFVASCSSLWVEESEWATGCSGILAAKKYSDKRGECRKAHL